MFDAKASQPLQVRFPPWGIYVLESHHGSDFRMQTTAHDFFKIMYVLEGLGAIKWKNSAVPIRRGDVIAVQDGFAHLIEDDRAHALSLIVLCVQRQVQALMPDAALRSGGCRVFRNQALTLETRRVLRQLFFEQSLERPSCATMITGLTLQLLASLSRMQAPRASDEALYSRETPPETRVKAYVRELEHKYCENEKIDNVAERLGISRRYFTRLFRSATGHSWLNYVRDLRLQHAKTLLRKTDRTVLLVAFESGFDDLSSFYRAFKEAEGITPLQWRVGKK